MNESTNKPTIADRVKKMPHWLQQWYSETQAIIINKLDVDRDVVEQIAFALAVREYKRVEKNRESYGNALALVMSATDAFQFEVGESDRRFKVAVHPADGNGSLSLTVEPLDATKGEETK